ncbi:MAG: hypothetical protein JSU59_01880 [Nitrospirota bacterium]|nr:MAG: hypothetical protein JSU59_01880 [Nitrospirota bacterium]
MPTNTCNPSLDQLRGEFRHHLEKFYASLNLAPPYHSLEKAIRLLSIVGERKTVEELERLIEDSNLKWNFFDEIFLESGLSQKHRGIIQGLIESDQTRAIPAPYRNLLNAFHSKDKGSSEGS